jgi:hypothetical protein
VYTRARLREPLTLTRDSFPKLGLGTKRATLPKTLNNRYNKYIIFNIPLVKYLVELEEV